jgi:hypothetical protein
MVVVLYFAAFAEVAVSHAPFTEVVFCSCSSAAEPVQSFQYLYFKWCPLGSFSVLVLFLSGSFLHIWSLFSSTGQSSSLTVLKKLCLDFNLGSTSALYSYKGCRSSVSTLFFSFLAATSRRTLGEQFH